MRHSILNDNKAVLASLLEALQRPFNVVELGAGDGRKVAQMLREFIDRGLSCQYVPIDISAGALQSLNAKIDSQFGDGELNMTCVVADNMQVLRVLLCNSMPSFITSFFELTFAAAPRHRILQGAALGGEALAEGPLGEPAPLPRRQFGQLRARRSRSTPKGRVGNAP